MVLVGDLCERITGQTIRSTPPTVLGGPPIFTFDALSLSVISGLIYASVAACRALTNRLMPAH